MTELETYFLEARVVDDKQSQVARHTYAPWETMVAA